MILGAGISQRCTASLSWKLGSNSEDCGGRQAILYTKAWWDCGGILVVHF
jgi:hypothetical protein